MYSHTGCVELGNNGMGTKGAVTNPEGTKKTKNVTNLSASASYVRQSNSQVGG